MPSAPIGSASTLRTLSISTLGPHPVFFRFGAAIVLIVIISLANIALAKQSLHLKREISLQHFRVDRLMERHAKLRLQAQQWGAPHRWIEPLEQGELDVRPPQSSTTQQPRPTPLLQWQHRPAQR